MSMSAFYIVFSGKTDVWWLRLLRPGFRHCFALVRDTERWIVVDPMLHKMEVLTTACPHDFDLPAWMRARGYRVLRVPVLTPMRRALAPAPFTCVEAMKRLIGLQEWRIFTPWQLYRRLVALNSQ
ncbi:MAG: hypothetical protein EBQ96_02695 [Proteobacteria bacterium]|nr:hypothetical protein [Pseudomonadota bacterium]